MDSRPKNPVLVEAGKRGARKRWGEHGRILRLDELDPSTRDVVNSILTARRNAAEAAARASGQG
jgi:hypothetical protein